MKICGTSAQGSTTQKTAEVIHRLSTNLMLGLPIEEAISATKEQVQEEDDFYHQYGFKRGCYDNCSWSANEGKCSGGL